MTATTFDTLKLARSLAAAGFTPQQADGASAALAEAIADSGATRADIADVRRDIAEAKAETLKWMAGAIGLQTVVIISAVIALTHVVRP